MGSWWRSEEMTYVALILPEVAAVSSISELGALGCVQFTDMTPELTPFQRRHVTNIKKCDELERKIRYLHTEIKKMGLRVIPAGSVDHFVNKGSFDSDREVSGAFLLEELDTKLESYEKQLIELNKFGVKLAEVFVRTVELHHVLTKARDLFLSEVQTGIDFGDNTGDGTSRVSFRASSTISRNTDVRVAGGINYAYRNTTGGVSLHAPGIPRNSSQPNEANAESGNALVELAFSNIAGVVNSVDRYRFERMLFRATRGNCWVRFASVTTEENAHLMEICNIQSGSAAATFNARNDDDNTSTTDLMSKVPKEIRNEPMKDVFIIFFKSEAIKARIVKICDAFNARRHDMQTSLDNFNDLLAQQETNFKELKEAKIVLDKNIRARSEICNEVSMSIEKYLWIVRREKSIYHTLNLFQSNIRQHAPTAPPISGTFDVNSSFGSRDSEATDISTSSNMLLHGRAWVMKDSLPAVKEALARASRVLNIHSSAIVDRIPQRDWPLPPTHFKTNKYTDAFQEFVNTYGIPRYREANPALFTAATFPFLFGIMYGDIGHGFCLAIFGLMLILTESAADSREMSEMMKGIYSARYMLFGMGMCAVYAGSVYNDFFSLGLQLFGSNYQFRSHEVDADAIVLSKYGDASKVYPYGIDPAWQIADNKLLFFNSFKMKLSVILGVTQMTWGILLKGINAVYFKQWLDLVCEVIPMILFDLCFFGYMVVLIFVKWSINWHGRMQKGTCGYFENHTFGCVLSDANPTCWTSDGRKCNVDSTVGYICPLNMGGASNGCQPPNLITTLINIALQPGSVDEPMFSGQATLQTAILLIAFVCVPWLLCVKPYVLKSRHERAALEHSVNDLHQHLLSSEYVNEDRKDSEDERNAILFQKPIEGSGKSNRSSSNNNTSKRRKNDDSNTSNTNKRRKSDDSDVSNFLPLGAGGHGSGHGQFNFGEIFIHQCIETIEFVLGMISNTASYLRLWALSLAHTELAEVFWEKAMLQTIEMDNPFAIYVGYALFAAVTFAVLMCMDVLECFLHALRLHWVEFQNKFYKADGVRFQPLDFKAIINRALLE